MISVQVPSLPAHFLLIEGFGIACHSQYWYTHHRTDNNLNSSPLSINWLSFTKTVSCAIVKIVFLPIFGSRDCVFGWFCKVLRGSPLRAEAWCCEYPSCSNFNLFCNCSPFHRTLCFTLWPMTFRQETVPCM